MAESRIYFKNPIAAGVYRFLIAADISIHKTTVFRCPDETQLRDLLSELFDNVNRSVLANIIKDCKKTQESKKNDKKS